MIATKLSTDFSNPNSNNKPQHRNLYTGNIDPIAERKRFQSSRLPSSIRASRTTFWITKGLRYQPVSSPRPPVPKLLIARYVFSKNFRVWRGYSKGAERYQKADYLLLHEVPVLETSHFPSFILGFETLEEDRGEPREAGGETRVEREVIGTWAYVVYWFTFNGFSFLFEPWYVLVSQLFQLLLLHHSVYRLTLK